MRTIKFSRRSLLRGLGAGSVLLSPMSKTLYAQAGAPAGAGGVLLLRQRLAPRLGPHRQRRGLRAVAPPGADGAHPQGHHRSSATCASSGAAATRTGAPRSRPSARATPRSASIRCWPTTSRPWSPRWSSRSADQRRRRPHREPVAAQRRLHERRPQPGGRLPAHRRAGDRRARAPLGGHPAHDHPGGHREGAAAAQEPARLRPGGRQHLPGPPGRRREVEVRLLPGLAAHAGAGHRRQRVAGRTSSPAPSAPRSRPADAEPRTPRSTTCRR